MWIQPRPLDLCSAVRGLLIHASSCISSVAKHHRKSHPPYLVLFSTHLVYITRLIQYQILLYRIVTTIWFRTIPLICARLAEKACGKMAESIERDTLARKMSGSQACQNVLITWEINNSEWKLLLKLSALHTLNSGLSISRLKTLRYQRERLWQRSLTSSSAPLSDLSNGSPAPVTKARRSSPKGYIFLSMRFLANPHVWAPLWPEQEFTNLCFPRLSLTLSLPLSSLC